MMCIFEIKIRYFAQLYRASLYYQSLFISTADALYICLRVH